MKLYFHRDFEKRYQLCEKGIQKRIQERIRLFRENPFHPILENHPLQGRYRGYRSINIAGDLRAVFQRTGTDNYWFMKLGTHSELYA